LVGPDKPIFNQMSIILAECGTVIKITRLPF
jgi:hypothetical protein